MKPKKLFSSNQNRRKFIGLLLSGLIVTSSIFYFPSCKSNNSKSNSTRLIVGWQTAWATCGQIIETLDHTNITNLYKSNATFRNFLFGPDMLEAALGGNIDATTTGIVPSVNLMAASDEWVGVCRLIDFSVVTIAREGTNIKSYKDLAGKKLGVPFGSGAHPYVVQRLEENNLSIGTGADQVELVNVSPAEGAVVLQQGGVDALGIWEPNATIIESKNIGKVFDEKPYIGLLTIRKSIVDEHPEEVVALIKSIIEANLYVAKNREQTDKWFAERSNFDRELLTKIRIIESNLNAKTIEDISVELTPDDINECQLVADKMFESDLIKRKINLSERLNLDLAKKAKDELVKSQIKNVEIKILDK